MARPVQNPDAPVSSRRATKTSNKSSSRPKYRGTTYGGQDSLKALEKVGPSATIRTPRTQPRVERGTPRVTPAPRNRGGGGGYGGGGAINSYSGGELGISPMGTVAEVSPPQPMSDEDWWAQDSGFQAESGSLKSALDSALASLKQQRAGYDTDFMTTLRNLGWGWGDNTKLDGFEKGAFDPANSLGAYGQGLTNLNNDFASRGLMDSSFFADALTDFNTDMNNQYQGLVSNRNQFNNERAAEELAANNEYQSALARARATSLGRRDAQYGIF